MSSLDHALRFADRSIARLVTLGVDVDVDAESLIWTRARMRGIEPTGQVSAGGACRLLVAADGWCAVNLPRPDDLELLPAWLGVEAVDDGVPWAAIAGVVAERATSDLVADGQILGLAVASVPSTSDEVDEQLAVRGTEHPARPWLVRRLREPSDVRSIDDLRVVDLSSLWAGPLCARFLARAGARVTKVESTTRPDGARLGDPEFYAWLHGQQTDRAVSFAPDDLAELHEVLADADVVIEGSRPRALDRLGIDPASFVAARPGRVWVSITAYGRCGPWADRVGFGDDAAAAGGLVDVDTEGPTFVGDAIADPLTGALAAALVVDAVRSGGGRTIDVSLRESARSAANDAVVVW